MNKPRSCGTCNMAQDFQLTPTGRFRTDTVGHCGYHIALPVLPASVRNDGFSTLLFHPDKAKGGVRPSDGADCPVYASKNT